MSCSIEQNQPLREIYFYLTEECNLCCKHCWILPKFMGKGQDVQHYLPLDTFYSIIDQGKKLGLQNAKLTGGEPLLHPKIKEIISYLNENDIYLVMETNGVLLTPEIADLIKANKRAFVSVSLDSHVKEKHEKVRGVKGCFEDTIRGITLLSERKVENQIIMSLLNENVDDIDPLVSLAEELGVKSVKFNLIQPTEKGERLHEHNLIPTVAEYIEIGRYVREELQPKTGVTLFYDIPPAFLPLSKVYGQKSYLCTCGIDKILGIVWTGDVSICGIGQNQKDLVLGNVHTDSIETIWNNEKLEPVKCNVVDNLEGVCKNCLMKVQCKGKCLAQNYYRTENLFSGFWFCEEAYETGVFPESRLTTASVSAIG